MGIEYSLFNGADDCLAHSLRGGIFEESLLLNVLFQERLLVHEAYFFNSTLLVDHIKSAQGRPALFEIAAKAGLIVPAFRDPNRESLDQAFEQMKGEYGQGYVLLHPDVQRRHRAGRVQRRTRPGPRAPGRCCRTGPVGGHRPADLDTAAPLRGLARSRGVPLPHRPRRSGPLPQPPRHRAGTRSPRRDRRLRPGRPVAVLGISDRALRPGRARPRARRRFRGRHHSPRGTPNPVRGGAAVHLAGPAPTPDHATLTALLVTGRQVRTRKGARGRWRARRR